MTNFGMWIDLLDEGIPLLFLIALGLAFFRGFRKNHALLTEREELLKRYLLFRGEKQVRLKVFGEDDKAYQELLKTISNSWKTFKKASDHYLASLAQNTTRTRLFLHRFRQEPGIAAKFFLRATQIVITIVGFEEEVSALSVARAP